MKPQVALLWSINGTSLIGVAVIQLGMGRELQLWFDNMPWTMSGYLVVRWYCLSSATYLSERQAGKIYSFMQKVYRQ